jgi:Na+/melibiose symporter-like transporter
MLGDSADYSKWENKRRATGLIYSAGMFVQKTGGGFAGALVLVELAGYVKTIGAELNLRRASQ